jgi:3-hydroxypropanoate dehydrogenase
MLGYDAAGVDAELFAATTLQTVLVVNIGYPGKNPWMERLPRLGHPRLGHDEAITWA